MKNRRHTYITVLYWVLVFAGFYVIDQHNDLLLHGLTEVFRVVVACAIFMVAWHSHQHSGGSYFLLVGLAYLSVGGMALLHVLSDPGMEVFSRYGLNLSIQLRLADRYVESISLLLAPLLINRRMRIPPVILGYVTVSFLILASIFYWNTFPDCFIEAEGPTLFKVISGYVILLVLLGALLLHRKRYEFERSALQMLMGSIAASIGSELVLILYVDPRGVPNAVEHFLRVVSLVLMYRAIIAAGLEAPYSSLFNRLQASEERYRVLIESAGEAVLVVQDGMLKFANPTAERLTGYSLEQLRALPPIELIHLEDRETVLLYHQERLAGRRTPPNHQFRMVDRDGSVKWIETTVVTIDWDGKPATLGLFTDITGWRQAEEALKESEQSLSTAQEIAHIGSWVWNITTDEIHWSDEMYRILGLPLGTTPSNEHVQELIHPGDRRLFEQAMAAIFQGNAPAHLEYRIIRQADGLRFVQARGKVSYDQLGNPLQMVGTLQDVTEQRQARDEIKRFKTIFDNANFGAAIHDPDGNLIYVNACFASVHGYQSPELLGEDLSVFHTEEQLAEVTALLQRLKSTGNFNATEVWHVHRDGTEFPMLMNGMVIQDADGAPTMMAVTAINITERKQYESEQQTTLHLLQLMRDESDLHTLMKEITAAMRSWSDCEAVGIRLRQGDDCPYFVTRGFPAEFVQAEQRLCALDEKGELVRDSMGSPVLECMCGYIISGRSDPSLPFFTEMGTFWTNSTTELLASTSEAEHQIWMRGRCNEEGYESVLLIPLTIGKQTLGLLQFNDTRPGQFNEKKISFLERLASNVAVGLSQRLTALALQENQANLSALIENTDGSIWSVDRDYRLIVGNLVFHHNTLMASGRSLSSGDSLLAEDLLGETQAEWRNHYDRALQGERLSIQTQRQVRDASRTMEYHLNPIRATDDEVVGVSIFGRDITKSKHAQLALAESEERYRTLVNASPSAIMAVQNGQFVFANPAATKLLGSPSPGETIGLAVLDHIAPASRQLVAKQLQNATAGETNPPTEIEMIRSDGSTLLVESTSVPVMLQGEFAVLILGQDVTERRQAEKALQASLVEKEVLLQEIHHRVKNNLQFICSLLNLQSVQIEDVDVRQMLDHSQHRVRAMALVHEKLYGSADLASIPFRDYIQDLARAIFYSFSVPNDGVQMKIDADNVVLNIDTAVCCGLILNELISNALEHAFPDGRSGELYIKFRYIADVGLELVVSDNGIGLPEEFDIQSTESLGLRLVQLLTRQLDGSLEVRRDQGTQFLLTFVSPITKAEGD